MTDETMNVTHNAALASAFPDTWERLQYLRTHSASLDEICQDFELLTSIRARAQQEAGADTALILAQIDDSLSGLKEEIMRYLSCSKVQTMPITHAAMRED
ncbi:hypothetical protein [uncultured Shimia sp.]|uniref:hypothetical protein n=1 Tax=uncultured Shimia sp. TaxID=573152 RepID=UPI00260ADFC3|nr:hypothetical protein [uncultured Shimia sp.]